MPSGVRQLPQMDVDPTGAIPYGGRTPASCEPLIVAWGIKPRKKIHGSLRRSLFMDGYERPAALDGPNRDRLAEHTGPHLRLDAMNYCDNPSAHRDSPGPPCLVYDWIQLLRPDGRCPIAAENIDLKELNDGLESMVPLMNGMACLHARSTSLYANMMRCVDRALNSFAPDRSYL